MRVSSEYALAAHWRGCRVPSTGRPSCGGKSSSIGRAKAGTTRTFARLADGHDDPGVVGTRQPNWHRRLPDPPASFPQEASFALTRGEADFLRGRLEEQCADTLLGWLARKGSDAPAEHFWDDPDAGRAPPKIRDTVELARRFSLHVQGIPLLYNLLLAEHRHADHGGDRELIDWYRAELAEWAASEAGEEAYEPHVLWDFVARRDFVTRRGGGVPDPQRRFVEAWSKRITEKGPDVVADDDGLRKLVEQREHQLKGARARLVNPNRLLDWNGSAGVGRMDFRWVRVRQLLIDLHRGLAA